MNGHDEYDFRIMYCSPFRPEMNGHGHDFGHEVVSESVSEADACPLISDSDDLEF